MSYRFAGEGTSGVVRGGRSVVSSTPDSAVFTYDVELEPHAIPKLARPILRWWLQHSLRRDLRRLRSFVVHAALRVIDPLDRVLGDEVRGRLHAPIGLRHEAVGRGGVALDRRPTRARASRAKTSTWASSLLRATSSAAAESVVLRPQRRRQHPSPPAGTQRAVPARLRPQRGATPTADSSAARAWSVVSERSQHSSEMRAGERGHAEVAGRLGLLDGDPQRGRTRRRSRRPGTGLGRDSRPDRPRSDGSRDVERSPTRVRSA